MTEIASLQREYEACKQRLATPQLDAKQVRMDVVGFFNSVTHNYNNSADNLVLTTTFFCDEDLQERFNSFVLDERGQMQVLVQRQWLHELAEGKSKRGESVKSVYKLVEGLIIKFSKIFSIDQVNASYLYYVERFSYIAILSVPAVDELLAKLLSTQRGQEEHARLAKNGKYALFCKLLHAKYLSLK